MGWKLKAILHDVFRDLDFMTDDDDFDNFGTTATGTELMQSAEYLINELSKADDIDNDLQLRLDEWKDKSNKKSKRMDSENSLTLFAFVFRILRQ